MRHSSHTYNISTNHYQPNEQHQTLTLRQVTIISMTTRISEKALSVSDTSFSFTHCRFPSLKLCIIKFWHFMLWKLFGFSCVSTCSCAWCCWHTPSFFVELYLYPLLRWPHRFQLNWFFPSSLWSCGVFYKLGKLLCVRGGMWKKTTGALNIILSSDHLKTC